MRRCGAWLTVLALLGAASCSGSGDGPFDVEIDVAYPDGVSSAGTVITVTGGDNVNIEESVDEDGRVSVTLGRGSYVVTSTLQTGTPGPTSGCTWSDRTELTVPDDGKLTLFPLESCA